MYRPIMSSNGFLGVEVRHLAALDAIATHGSFSAAAAELGYTQSAVSQQIATLERRVGRRLLERGGGSRHVELTEAGRLVQRHAREIVRRLAAAEADLGALEAARAGRVRMGTFQSVGVRIVPRLLSHLAAVAPDVDVEVVECVTCEGLEDAVAAGDIDVAFTLLPVPEGALEAVHLMDDEYLHVVPVGDPMADAAPVGPADLHGRGLIAYRDCRGQIVLEQHLHDLGVAPRVVTRTDDNGFMQALVAEGIAHALMPRLAFDPRDARVTALPTADIPPRRIALVRHADRTPTPAVEAVVAAAREVCGTPALI